MKIDEILSPEEKLKFAQLILASTYTEIAKAVGLTEPKRMLEPLGPSRANARKASIKPKAPKRVPMAPPPKPLPKPKPQPLTSTQIKNQQQKTQQNYAQTIKQAFDKDNQVKMPRSMQAPTGISIGRERAIDPDFEEKIQDAIKKAELSKRSNVSKPQSF
jgi:hypothetical protein